MIFTLEALEAKHGDALLLHYGDADNPQCIVIDGGPAGVYGTRLRKRLDQLRASRTGDEHDPLSIRLVMVSHIDDDHINGILALTDDLVKRKDAGKPRPYAFATIWHNSFDDLVKSVKAAAVGEGGGAEASLELAGADNGSPIPSHMQQSLSPDSALVLASVVQGRKLHANANRLGIPLNQGFRGLIVAPAKGALQYKVAHDLTFTIIGPRQDQLDALQNEWAKQIAAKKKAGTLKPADAEAAAAAFVDKSVFNLSSIVILAEADGKRMLLTGDARGDYILEGLEAAKLMDARGSVRVDLMKMPHHGSVHNIDDTFFERIVADHYVISADGKHDNPDIPTLEALFKARGNRPYTLHFTNHVPAVDEFLAKHKPSKVQTVFAEETDDPPSVWVDLAEELED